MNDKSAVVFDTLVESILPTRVVCQQVSVRSQRRADARFQADDQRIVSSAVPWNLVVIDFGGFSTPQPPVWVRAAGGWKMLGRT